MKNIEKIIQLQKIDSQLQEISELLGDLPFKVEKLKKEDDWIDYSTLDTIIIGMIGGDGIGPTISRETHRILEKLLENQVKSVEVKFVDIECLTIENRAEKLQSIPDDVLDIYDTFINRYVLCDVIGKHQINSKQSIQLCVKNVFSNVRIKKHWIRISHKISTRKIAKPVEFIHVIVMGNSTRHY